jgi:hypothetical protein
MIKKTDLNSQGKKYYRAICPNHDWEGMKREELIEAKKDLEAHCEMFDELHTDSKVIVESD